MITITNTKITGWEPAIRGARNPMNSWEKSDSLIFDYGFDGEDGWGKMSCYDILHNEKIIDSEEWSAPIDSDVLIGPNDLKLLKNLAQAGSDEAKFRRMIVVYVDVTAPMYWWKEADTYKVGTVRNSCSTMHKIHAKEFTLDDFSHEHLISFDDIPGWRDAIFTEIEEEHNAKVKVVINSPLIMVGDDSFLSPVGGLKIVIQMLNKCRELYLETKDKKYWWQMIQLLPSSYNQRATLMLNYEVLSNIYHARKNHKLDEWRELCQWIETLPYAKELIIGFQMRTDIYKPTVLSKDRILVNVCKEKDGVIELRRGVPDLYLGVGVNYAQSRILVDSDSYIKGMAVYSGDIPGAFDVVVNVRDKQRAFNELDYKCAFSKYSCQKLKQRFYEDPETGDIKLSPINVIVNDGDWKEWEKEFSSKIGTILAKPPIMGQFKRKEK